MSEETRNLRLVADRIMSADQQQEIERLTRERCHLEHQLSLGEQLNECLTRERDEALELLRMSYPEHMEEIFKLRRERDAAFAAIEELQSERDRKGSEMYLHPSAFEYLKPTEAQQKVMCELRQKFSDFVADVADALPFGSDKDHVIRLLRDAAMWANVALTRDDYGGPRDSR